MLPQRHKSALPHVKWVLPSAPMDNLVQMRSWFEISDEAIEKFRAHGKKDESIVDEPEKVPEMPANLVGKEGDDPIAAFVPAIRYIHSLIDAEVAAGIPSERIALVGFSQGGALSLLASVLGEQRLKADGSLDRPAASGKYAALFPIGTFLPGGDQWTLWKDDSSSKWKHSTANQETLHCLIHGTADLLVPVSASQKTADILKSIGFKGCFVLPYNGVQHWVTEKQIVDLGSFLSRVLE